MLEHYEPMDFGKLLEKLIQLSAQKNYALAAHLGYDVSYISKWINKSMLPANKNIQNICTHIAEFIISSSSASAVEYLNSFFYLDDEKEQPLKTVLETALMDCYEYSLQQHKDQSSHSHLMLNSHFSVNPRLQRFTLNHALPITGEEDMIIFTNLFTMGKEDKLSIAGFDNMLFKKNARLRCMFSLDKHGFDPIFDPLLLIYMISNYAEINFHLYLSDTVPCSLLLSIKDLYSHMSVLIENHRCIASHICTEKQLVNELYDTMEDVIHTQAKSVLISISMRQMMEEHYYMQSIISPAIRWLIGTMTELFLPHDLFTELLDEHFPEGSYREELQKNHMIMQNATYVSNVKIMIYESTLSKYILDGALDFFTKPITLTMPQRERHIAYMRELFCGRNFLEVRIAEGNFVEDFKKLNNPSLYLSDNLSYLRMENLEDKAIYLIRHKELVQVFSQFFNEIWNHRPDIVIQNEKEIQKKMDYYLNCFQLFSDLY